MGQRAAFSGDDLVTATGGTWLINRNSSALSPLCEYPGQVGPDDVFIAIARDAYVMQGTIAGEDRTIS